MADPTRAELENRIKDLEYDLKCWSDFDAPPKGLILKELTTCRMALRMEQAVKDAESLEKLNKFLRESIGECHLMISRGTSEFQLKDNWDNTSLPYRLGEIIKERDAAQAEVERLRKVMNAIYMEAIGDSQFMGEHIAKLCDLAVIADKKDKESNKDGPATEVGYQTGNNERTG